MATCSLRVYNVTGKGAAPRHIPASPIDNVEAIRLTDNPDQLAQVIDWLAERDVLAILCDNYQGHYLKIHTSDVPIKAFPDDCIMCGREPGFYLARRF